MLHAIRRGDILLLIAIIVFLVDSNPAIAQEYVKPFVGRPLLRLLEPSVRIACEGDMAASTGYYPKDNLPMLDPTKRTELVLRSRFEKQVKGAKWNITLERDRALVVDPDDTSVSPGPQEFQIVRRDSNSLMLVRVKPGVLGNTIEVLTIDPANGSFVSSSPGVGPLWNRTTVWVGRCQ